jgi:hypothetical protein
VSDQPLLAPTLERLLGDAEPFRDEALRERELKPKRAAG